MMPSSAGGKQEKQDRDNLAARKRFAQKINEAKKCYVVTDIYITVGKTATSRGNINIAMKYASTRRKTKRHNIGIDPKYRGQAHQKVLDAHGAKIREQVNDVVV